MALSVHLVAIDPQNDFCDPNGSLFVPGATDDIKRLAALVTRLKDKLADVHVTLDSHRKVDISHPMWWKDSSGRAPNPFTLISAADVAAGRWTTHLPSFYDRTLKYLRDLESRGRYVHTIWPEHCLIGDEGHNIHPELSAALHDWEQSRFAQVEFVTKGSNPWTEHFSAIEAEVPDPNDPTTQLNTGFIQTLEQADVVLLAGEALSHCVMSTVRDIAHYFSDPTYARKLILLEDCSSKVPDPPNMTIFTDATNRFLSDMKSKGMKIQKSTEVLT